MNFAPRPIYSLLAAVLLVATAGAPAWARTARPKIYVPEDMRSLDGGRKVLIVLHSDRPGEDNPDVQRVASELAPLRKVLARDEFETRMPGRLEAVLSAVPWMGARDFEVTNNYRWGRIERALDDSNTRQMLVIRTEHALSPDFTEMLVYMRALLLNRQIPKGKTSHARFTQDYTPYQLDFTARVFLPGAVPTQHAENQRRWAADDGRLARAAIEFGIEWVTTRFAQTLAEDERQSLAWRERGDRKGTLPKGHPGWILERLPEAIVSYESRRRSLTYEGTLAP